MSGVGDREPPDVRLVDDASRCTGVRGGRSPPQSKNGLTTTDFGMCGAESASLRWFGVVEPVREDRLRPSCTSPSTALPYGSSSSFCGLQRRPVARVVGPGDAVAVALAGADVRQVAVPDEGVDLAQRGTRVSVRRVVVEQAQLDRLGDLAEQREVGAGAVVGGAERIRGTRARSA